MVRLSSQNSGTKPSLDDAQRGKERVGKRKGAFDQRAPSFNRGDKLFSETRCSPAKLPMSQAHPQTRPLAKRNGVSMIRLDLLSIVPGAHQNSVAIIEKYGMDGQGTVCRVCRQRAVKQGALLVR